MREIDDSNRENRSLESLAAAALYIFLLPLLSMSYWEFGLLSV
jgi:hypothetical protein